MLVYELYAGKASMNQFTLVWLQNCEPAELPNGLWATRRWDGSVFTDHSRNQPTQNKTGGMRVSCSSCESGIWIFPRTHKGKSNVLISGKSFSGYREKQWVKSYHMAIISCCVTRNPWMLNRYWTEATERDDVLSMKMTLAKNLYFALQNSNVPIQLRNQLFTNVLQPN